MFLPVANFIQDDLVILCDAATEAANPTRQRGRGHGGFQLPATSGAFSRQCQPLHGSASHSTANPTRHLPNTILQYWKCSKGHALQHFYMVVNIRYSKTLVYILIYFYMFLYV